MNLPEIIEGLKLLEALEVARPLIIIFVIWSIGFIKIKNKAGEKETLWARLLKKTGEDINWKVLNSVKAVDEKFTERMDQIEENLDAHITEDSERWGDYLAEEEKNKVLNYRQKIIRFADEIYQGRNHSKEHYDEIRSYIDIYETYSEKHPNFPNNKAKSSIKYINESYEEKLRDHTFLNPEDQ